MVETLAKFTNLYDNVKFVVVQFFYYVVIFFAILDGVNVICLEASRSEFLCNLYAVLVIQC